MTPRLVHTGKPVLQSLWDTVSVFEVVYAWLKEILCASKGMDFSNIRRLSFQIDLALGEKSKTKQEQITTTTTKNSGESLCMPILEKLLSNHPW